MNNSGLSAVMVDLSPQKEEKDWGRYVQAKKVNEEWQYATLT